MRYQRPRVSQLDDYVTGHVTRILVASVGTVGRRVCIAQQQQQQPGKYCIQLLLLGRIAKQSMGCGLLLHT